MYKRGNIVWINLGVGIGSEQGGLRPCLIVQNNMGNKFSPCIIVLPMTNSVTKTKIPTQSKVFLTDHWSLIYGEQIRTVDKRRVQEDRGILDTITDMVLIDKIMCISLGIKHVS